MIAVGPLATASTWAGAGLRGGCRRRRPGPRRLPRRRSTRPDAARQRSSCSGADARGVLFGVGRLLRELRMTSGSVRVPPGLAIVSAPQVALRGHQLGYRPKTNAYDAWDVPMWEQYIRDLAIFGSNAIELIPPRSDDAADSPHFPLPQIDMMVEMSRIADEYGQDVWIWYPALDKDYGDPKQVEFALKEWADVFSEAAAHRRGLRARRRSRATREPKHLMALLERQTASLRKYPPEGGRCGSRRRASRKPGWTSSTRSSRPSRPG